MAEFTDQDILDLLTQDPASDFAAAPKTGMTPVSPETSGAAPTFGVVGAAPTPDEGISPQLAGGEAFQRMSGAFQSGNIDKYINPDHTFNWALMDKDAAEMRAQLGKSTFLDDLIAPMLFSVISMGFSTVLAPALAGAGLSSGAANSMANTLANTAIQGVMTGKVDLQSTAQSLLSNYAAPLIGQSVAQSLPDLDPTTKSAVANAAASGAATAIKGGNIGQDLKNAIAGAVTSELKVIDPGLAKAVGTYISTGNVATSLVSGIARDISGAPAAPAAGKPSVAELPASDPMAAMIEELPLVSGDPYVLNPDVPVTSTPAPAPEPPAPAATTVAPVEVTGAAVSPVDQAMIDLVSRAPAPPSVAAAPTPESTPTPAPTAAEPAPPAPAAPVPPAPPVPEPTPTPAQAVEVTGQALPAVDQAMLDMISQTAPAAPPPPPAPAAPAPEPAPAPTPEAQQVEVKGQLPVSTPSDADLIALLDRDIAATTPVGPPTPPVPAAEQVPPPQEKSEIPPAATQQVEVTKVATPEAADAISDVAPKPEQAGPAAPVPTATEQTKPLLPVAGQTPDQTQRVEVTGPGTISEQDIIDLITPTETQLELPTIPPAAAPEPAPAPAAAEPELQRAEITAPKAEITDEDIASLISQPATPEVQLPAIPTEAQQVTVTGQKAAPEQVEPISEVAPTDTGGEPKPEPAKAEEVAKPAEVTKPEEPAKPTDLDIYSYVPTKTRKPSLAQLLTVRQYPTTGVTQGLAPRAPGEIESEVTGKKRRNVWNEASLRLKDALGL